MKLYRVNGRQTTSAPDYGFGASAFPLTHRKLEVEEYDVVKETPQGKWVNVWGIKKWVSNTSRKRYAHPTVEEAYKAFVYRKKKQMKLLNAELRACKEYLELAEEAVRTEDYDKPLTNSLSYA